MNGGRYPGPTEVSRLGAVGPSLERLEARWLLSGVSFGPQELIVPEDLAIGALCVRAADIDGDGDLDVLSVSQDDGKVAWYENTDGAGSFGEQQVIVANEDGYPCGAEAADLDGDGDLDVLVGFRADGKIVWYENTDGAGSFGPRQVITTNADEVASVCAGDLDGDGDLDVLAALELDEMIVWYENADGAGTFASRHVVAADAGLILCIARAADLDGDGDLDVLAATEWDNDNVSWYENTDGAGSFGPQQVITTDVIGPWCVCAADLDGDGDLDVLSASFWDDKIAWYENTDGAGSFGAQQVITSEAISANWVCAADMDGDGDLDVLAGCDWPPDVAWYENTDGAGAFAARWTVTPEDSDGAGFVCAGDLDGDGDLDVLSASSGDDTIAWYRNLGAQPVTLIAPAAAADHDRAERCWIDWIGNGQTLELWCFGPAGLQRIAVDLAVWTGTYGWEAADVSLGWHTFVARVTPGGAQSEYTVSSPGWLRLIDPSAQSASQTPLTAHLAPTSGVTAWEARAPFACPCEDAPTIGSTFASCGSAARAPSRVPMGPHPSTSADTSPRDPRDPVHPDALLVTAALDLLTDGGDVLAEKR